MTSFKKVMTAGAMVLAIGVTTLTVFAADYKTPAEAVAGITGRTVESVIAERASTGKTYGTMAAEAGQLEAFQAEMLAIKKDNLNALVEAGTITQERADAILQAIEDNQALCDGTGRGMGGGCGGRGMGWQGGSCYYLNN